MTYIQKESVITVKDNPQRTAIKTNSICQEPSTKKLGGSNAKTKYSKS